MAIVSALLLLWIAKKIFSGLLWLIDRIPAARSLPDPEPEPFEFDEPEPEPEPDTATLERIENLRGLRQEYTALYDAIEKELASTVKPARITQLTARRAAVAEKLYKLQVQIDKEQEKLYY